MSKTLDQVTELECYDIAVMEGWKCIWELDNGVDTITFEELSERGREILDGEFTIGWIHSLEKINEYLQKKGYEKLTLKNNE